MQDAVSLGLVSIRWDFPQHSGRDQDAPALSQRVRTSESGSSFSALTTPCPHCCSEPTVPSHPSTLVLVCVARNAFSFRPTGQTLDDWVLIKDHRFFIIFSGFRFALLFYH